MDWIIETDCMSDLIRILLNITEMEKLERLNEIKSVLYDFQEVNTGIGFVIMRNTAIFIEKDNLILSEPTNTVVIIIYTLLVTFAGNWRRK